MGKNSARGNGIAGGATKVKGAASRSYQTNPCNVKNSGRKCNTGGKEK